MKKYLNVLIVFCIALFGGVLFVACGGKSDDPPPSKPAAPTLSKSSIYIKYDFSQEDYVGSYKLYFAGKNALKYKVEFVDEDIETIETQDYFISIDELEPEVVHTVKITAFGSADQVASPVEVKFKGVKLDAPTNFRVNYSEKQIEWDTEIGSESILLSFERLNGSNEGTGIIVKDTTSSDCISLLSLDYLFGKLDLCGFAQRMRIQSIPGMYQDFYYFNNPNNLNEDGVLEYAVASDYGEEADGKPVCLLGQSMENPTEVAFKTDASGNPTTTVKWKAPSSNYSYSVMVSDLYGSASGLQTQKGDTEGSISIENRSSGEYFVFVRSVCTDVRRLQIDTDVYAFTFYVTKPIEESEKLYIEIENNKLNPPTNVHIEGENIVWDRAENDGGGYWVSIHSTLDDDFGGSRTTDTNSLSLESVYELFENTDRNFDNEVFEIRVNTESDKLKVSVQNGKTKFTYFKYSEVSEVTEESIIKLNSINKTNIRYDSDTKTVSWDATYNASEYEIRFYNGNNSYTRYTVTGQSYTVTNGLEAGELESGNVTKIVLVALAENKFEEPAGGFVTLNMPSISVYEF